MRYVLEGSVRRLADHIRNTVQLIDARTDAHLWTERFDRDISDLFILQEPRFADDPSTFVRWSTSINGPNPQFGAADLNGR